jgi:hypothetical protein
VPQRGQRVARGRRVCEWSEIDRPPKRSGVDQRISARIVRIERGQCIVRVLRDSDEPIKTRAQVRCDRAAKVRIRGIGKPFILAAGQ